MDMLRKVNRKSSDELLGGEHFLAATFGQPAGTQGKMAVFGALGVLAFALLGKGKGGDRSPSAADGLGKYLTNTHAVIGLSNQRVLFFSKGRLMANPKGLAKAVDLSEITHVSAQAKLVVQTLSIGFEDGSTAHFEVPRAAHPAKFAEAYKNLIYRKDSL